MKIVILDGYTENPGDLSWEGFESLGTLTVYDRTEPNEIVSRIGDAEAVIVNKSGNKAIDAAVETLLADLKVAPVTPQAATVPVTLEIR